MGPAPSGAEGLTMWEAWITAAARGVTKAVLDKAEEMWKEETVATDSKTDPGFLSRLKESIAKKVGADKPKTP